MYFSGVFCTPGAGVMGKNTFLQSIHNHSTELDIFFLKWPHLFILVAYFTNYKHLNAESYIVYQPYFDNIEKKTRKS